jgi:hypothetical protein
MSGTPAALRAVSSVRYSGTLRAILSADRNPFWKIGQKWSKLRIYKKSSEMPLYIGSPEDFASFHYEQ